MESKVRFQKSAKVLSIEMMEDNYVKVRRETFYPDMRLEEFVSHLVADQFKLVTDPKQLQTIIYEHLKNYSNEKTVQKVQQKEIKRLSKKVPKTFGKVKELQPIKRGHKIVGENPEK